MAASPTARGRGRGRGRGRSAATPTHTGTGCGSSRNTKPDANGKKQQQRSSVNLDSDDEDVDMDENGVTIMSGTESIAIPNLDTAASSSVKIDCATESTGHPSASVASHVAIGSDHVDVVGLSFLNSLTITVCDDSSALCNAGAAYRSSFTSVNSIMSLLYPFQTLQNRMNDEARTTPTATTAALTQRLTSRPSLFPLALPMSRPALLRRLCSQSLVTVRTLSGIALPSGGIGVKSRFLSGLTSNDPSGTALRTLIRKLDAAARLGSSSSDTGAINSSGSSTANAGDSLYGDMFTA